MSGARSKVATHDVQGLPGNGLLVEAPIRVRYAETDQMGVAYHSNFLIWFEVGRVEYLRHLGYAYGDMEKIDGLHIPVVDVRCRYNAPARYDDELLVQTRLANVRDSLLHFRYVILRANDRMKLAEGESTHIVVNARMEKVSLPEKYSQTLQTAMQVK